MIEVGLMRVVTSSIKDTKIKAIEMETTLSPDGKLPASFREAFGRKVRVIILFQEEEQQKATTEDGSVRLMELAGKVKAFQGIDDPVAFQQKLRGQS
ncbi:MAG TPA: hypothetical protein P5526_31775 [Anaerolineae bacterium]|nr:hypothetical protein [Anaerolineae bacterium]